MEFLLGGLVSANIRWLRRNPHCPALYRSGVRYQHEPDGEDDWQDIPETLARMHGDCEDLACWRVGELREAHEDAQPWITVDLLPNLSGKLITTYHIRVRRPPNARIEVPARAIERLPDGSLIEDPSRALGMP